MSRYNNLPGVNIDVKDGQMMLTQDNSSNSMLIIGTVKAPASIEVKEDAVLTQNEDTLFENFGRYFYQGEVNPIAAEWYVARQAGIQNIYLLGLPAVDTREERFVKLHDLLDNVIADYQFSHIVVADMYANESILLEAADYDVEDLEEVNGVSIRFSKTSKNELKSLGLTDDTAILTVKHNEVEISLIASRSENDPKVLAKHLTDEYRKGASALGLDVDVQFILFNDLVEVQATHQVELEGVEILTALGLDEVPFTKVGYGNVAELLGNFAERQTVESTAAIVYVPATPPAHTQKSEIRATVDELIATPNEFSKHVQVVAGPQVGVSLPGNLRTQWLTGVTNYAVLVDSLAVQNAPTNQPLPGATALRYDLSLRQLNDLTANKYVTFRTKNNRIVVVDGVTTAPDLYVGQNIVRSDFTRLSTLRSINYIVEGIRAVTDPFIGQPNEFPTYNALNTAIRSLISRSIELGVIQDAAYSIALGANMEMDKATINMTILPQFELRAIDVSIGLATPSGFETIAQ